MAFDSNVLSCEERMRFHREGYLGPFAIGRPEAVREICARLEREVQPTPGPWAGNPDQMRHLDSAEVRGLVAHPAIVERLAGLYGADLACWRSNFFFKAPGGKEVPWHQDAEFWELDPPVNVTCWLALDDVTRENACMQIVPGSHKRILPHVAAGEEMLFAKMADPKLVPLEKAIDVELKAGEFILFNERLLHHSEANRSARWRKNMVIRYTVPFVHVPPLYEGYTLTMVRGEDRFNLNPSVALAELAAV